MASSKTKKVLIVVSWWVAFGFAYAERDPKPAAGISAAMALLQSHDADGAIKILKEITTNEPKNTKAWRALGAAFKEKHDWNQALSAYQEALKNGPEAPTTLYGMGALYSLKGDNDKAFEWLAKAKATKKADLTGIDQDSDLSSLKSDPRFAELRPKAEDFRDPFVEKVRVIREWDGEGRNDQFGWIARSVGDVDGDRIPDFVTSAPTNSAGGENAGRVYLYSTGTGKLLWQKTGEPKGQLGSGLECAGDVNADGISDVVASAPYAGVVYIYSGKDGSVLYTFKSPHPGKESFGQHVDGVGDINGDGFSDIIVGAPPPPPPYLPAGKGVGHAYLYSGKDGTLLLTLSGETEGDRFGSAVAGYSRAGQSLLVVGAPQGGPRHKGRVYVYDSLSLKPRFIIEGDDTSVGLGAMFVSVLGDLNADGTPDVYASDWSNSAKGPSTGRIYVYSGRDGKHLLTLTGEAEGEGFGTCPGIAGDVDGDGYPDLIIGAWQYSGGAMSAGRASIFSGKTGELVQTYTCRTPGDTFGFDAVGLGDVDRDGKIDFLVTSGWSGIHGYHSGRVFLIGGGVSKK